MSYTAWQRKAPDAYWKQGDTSPAIAEQLLDGLGAPVDLQGAAVRFIGSFPGVGTAEIDQPAVVDQVGNGSDGSKGKVHYTPVTADTDTLGDLLVEWKVTFGGGAIERFPNSDWQKVRIKQKAA